MAKQKIRIRLRLLKLQSGLVLKFQVLSRYQLNGLSTRLSVHHTSLRSHGNNSKCVPTSG